MAGAMLRGRRDDRWDGLLEELQRSNLDHLAAALPDYRQHRSMLAALKASVDELSEDVRSRFFDVAVCARYGAVPESVLHQLKMWDAGTGEMRQTLEGHPGAVNAVALSGDGRTVLSGSTDPVVLVWDGTSGSLARKLEGHRGSVLAVAISQDSRTAVSGSTDQTLKVWDLASGRVVWTLEGHDGWVQAVALTSDGAMAISTGLKDKMIRVWDLRSGELLTSFTAESAVTSVALDSSDRLLAGDAVGRLHLLKPWMAR